MAQPVPGVVQLQPCVRPCPAFRDRRRVALTDAGVLFLQDAKLLISQTARVADRLRQAENGEVGAARVGRALHLADKVGRMVVEHAKRYPAVDIRCHSIFSTLQNAALVQGKIDIGFLRPPVDTVGLNCEFLYEERRIAMMSKANRLAKRKTLPITRCGTLVSLRLFLRPGDRVRTPSGPSLSLKQENVVEDLVGYIELR